MVAETVFTMDTSSIKFGAGATREVGYDMAALGVKRIMVVTDPNLTNSEPVTVALASLRAAGLDAVLYDQVRVEPSDKSFKDAIRFATDGVFDQLEDDGGAEAIARNVNGQGNMFAALREGLTRSLERGPQKDDITLVLLRRREANTPAVLLRFAPARGDDVPV